ncbi:10385_t:CDS:2, partial [Diversispora eburnea]
MPMTDIHSKEQKGDQRLVLPSGFEKSISTNNRGLTPSSDPYLISEIQREEQQRHLSLQDITSYAETFWRPIFASDPYPVNGMVLPAIYPEKTIQNSLITDTFSNAHLANITRVIRSLRSGNDMRHTSGLADQYNIHVYSSAPPQISTERSNPDTLWQHTYENLPISGPPLPEWRSHTDDTMALGNSTETVFGSNASGVYGTASTGPKTLRAYKESDSMNLHDEL